MKTPPNNLLFHVLLTCMLLCFLAACGITPTTTQPVSTVAMPTTNTNCPSAGTARAMVTAPLARGTDQTIVYTVNEGPEDSPRWGILKHYDVATGKTTEIVKLPQVRLFTAQVSADGQWILFTSGTPHGQQSKLQIVRMDGQGLQTLYCASGFVDLIPQWSTNLKLIIFTGDAGLYLLHTQTGRVQQVLAVPNGVPTYLPATWLDNTRVYLVALVPETASSLYLLNTSKGPNQHASDLMTVFTPDQASASMTFDSSSDRAQLFVSVSANTPGTSGTPSPPSTLTVRPAVGGLASTILASSTLTISQVRVVSPTSLLLSVNSFAPSTDSSKNGIWKISTDGSGLTQLSTHGTLNGSSQYPWSNVSRDGSRYVAEQVDLQNQPAHDTLFFGPLNGSTLVTFASTADGAELKIAGWTTM
jgi:hypothetical protein